MVDNVNSSAEGDGGEGPDVYKVLGLFLLISFSFSYKKTKYLAIEIISKYVSRLLSVHALLIKCWLLFGLECCAKQKEVKPTAGVIN